MESSISSVWNYQYCGSRNDIFLWIPSSAVNIAAVNTAGMRRLLANDLITQPTRDVPEASSEGPLKVSTSGTFRGPSGDS